MKNTLLLLIVLSIFGCGRQVHNDKTVNQFDSSKTDRPHSTSSYTSTDRDSVFLSKEDKIIQELTDSTDNPKAYGGLNGIRFGNWTKKDWYVNEYFRTLRKYIDSCYNGDIEDEHLEPYKSLLKGKFVIVNVEPYLLGGLFITIIFLDAPDKLFDVSVYSYVEEESEEITGYEVRGLHIREDEESGLSKNGILAIIKEHPENKLW